MQAQLLGNVRADPVGDGIPNGGLLRRRCHFLAQANVVRVVGHFEVTTVTGRRRKPDRH